MQYGYAGADDWPVCALVGVVTSTRTLIGQVQPLIDCKGYGCESGEDSYCVGMGCGGCTTGGGFNEHCFPVQ